MAEILPFPILRRQAFIERQANVAAGLSETAGERYISHQVKLQRDAMARKGIGPVIIERELRTLDSAIRAALWRALLTPGGTA